MIKKNLSVNYKVSLIACFCTCRKSPVTVTLRKIVLTAVLFQKLNISQSSPEGIVAPA